MPTKWCRCPKTEAILDQFDVQWQWRDKVPLADIKRPAHIQSRMGASINQEWRDEYAEDMKNGDTFPAIVICKNGKGLTVAEGNHRYAAATKNEDSNLSAYVFESDDELISELLFHVMNDREGHRASVEDRIQSALKIQRAYGLSNRETANRFRISINQLARANRADKAIERLHEAGFNPRKVTTDSIILSDLDRVTNSVIFSALATFFEKYAKYLTQFRCRQIIGDVKKLRSEKESLKRIEELARVESAASKDKGPARRRTRTSRERLLREIEVFNRLINRFETLQQAGITDTHELNNCKHECLELANRIRKLVHDS